MAKSVLGLTPNLNSDRPEIRKSLYELTWRARPYLKSYFKQIKSVQLMRVGDSFRDLYRQNFNQSRIRTCKEYNLTLIMET
jgi:hypothetical protein